MREEVREGSMLPSVPLLLASDAAASVGLLLQGLFRLAAAASVVKRLKTCLDQGTVDHSEFSMDPHAVAGGALSTFHSALLVKSNMPTVVCYVQQC